MQSASVKTLIVENFTTKQCRCCLSPQVSAEETFQSIFDCNLWPILVDLTGIPLSSETRFPFVCSNCRMLLDLVENFRTKCRKSAEYFDALETNTGLKHDISSEHAYTASEALARDEVPEKEMQIIEAEEEIDFEEDAGPTEPETAEETYEYVITGYSSCNEADVVEVYEDFETFEIQEDQCSVEEPSTKSKRETINAKNRARRAERRKSGPTFYFCDHCPSKKFINRDTITRHMKETHLQAPVTCEFCHQSFQGQLILKQHIDRKHNNKFKTIPIQCRECGKIVLGQNAMRSHKTLVHSKYVDCEDCGKTFKSGSLKGHRRRVHQRESNDRPFSCPICGTRSKLKEDLRVHMKTHTGPKISCEECGARFLRPWELAKHQHKAHTSSFPKFQCEVCRKEFYRKTQYMKHLWVHKKESIENRQFPSDECDLQLTKQGDMSRHKRGLDIIREVQKPT